MKSAVRPKIHELKSTPPEYAEVNAGRNHAELRNDDRDYQRGDVLLLREWDEGAYTGRHCLARVTHVLRSSEQPYGAMLAAGVVLLSVRVYREPRSI